MFALHLQPSQEGLANIERQMLVIESGGAGVDLEMVNAVFRTTHSFKGTAGFLRLDRTVRWHTPWRSFRRDAQLRGRDELRNPLRPCFTDGIAEFFTGNSPTLGFRAAF